MHGAHRRLFCHQNPLQSAGYEWRKYWPTHPQSKGRNTMQSKIGSSGLARMGRFRLPALPSFFCLFRFEFLVTGCDWTPVSLRAMARVVRVICCISGSVAHSGGAFPPVSTKLCSSFSYCASSSCLSSSLSYRSAFHSSHVLRFCLIRELDLRTASSAATRAFSASSRKDSRSGEHGKALLRSTEGDVDCSRGFGSREGKSSSCAVA